MGILAEIRIDTIVRRIRRVYAFLIIMDLFLLFGLARHANEPVLNEAIERLIMLTLHSFLYFGLSEKKPWVIHLILICSLFGIIYGLIPILEPSSNFIRVLGKAIACLLVLFYAYQLSFFSKREVKAFFQEKGMILFC